MTPRRKDQALLKRKTKTNQDQEPKTNNAMETNQKGRKKTQEEKDNTMLQYDCDKIKRNAGFFFHTNTMTYPLKNSRKDLTASIFITLVTTLCVTSNGAKCYSSTEQEHDPSPDEDLPPKLKTR
jgi:hypothetical protein